LRHIGLAATVVAAPVLVGLLGIVIERLIVRRFYRADPICWLLLTFGLAMVVEQGLRMVFGASLYSMPDVVREQLVFDESPKSRIVMLVVAAVAVTLIWLLIYRTPFGRVVRAGAQDPEMTGALGISLEPYRMAIAAIGAGLAGLAGVLLVSIVPVHPAMGQEALTAAFVVLVVGGLGSFRGLAAAAFLVGIVRGLTLSVDPAASEALLFLLMLLVLLFRPRGLSAAPSRASA
jgi:branched-chain amino acid transport system permease protein